MIRSELIRKTYVYLNMIKRSSLIRIIFCVSLLATGFETYANNENMQSLEVNLRGDIVPIADARLKIESNATDFDAGIQVFIDADPWRLMEIFDPMGKRIFRSSTKGRFAKQGGTELFMESAEPEFSELPFEEFLERFPEGKYRFRGIGLEGEIFDGSATLTHNVPDGPVLVSPLEGGPLQDPNNTVVEWEPVLPPNGSSIIAYQVLVVQTDTSFPALPKVTLDVMMPANATSLAVPPGFLLPDTEYEWEVLAIEESGNQTLSSSFFTTMEGPSEEVEEWNDVAVFIEICGTDLDAGLKLLLDGLTPWCRAEIFGPNGQSIYRFTPRLGDVGSDNVFVESAEPPFTDIPLEELLDRFPQGEYTALGTTLEGGTLEGTAELTHNLPAGPAITSHEDDEIVELTGQNLVVTWDEVTEDFRGGTLNSEVIAYIVTVTVVKEVLDETIERDLVIDVPPDKFSAEIPADFLEPGAEVEIEVAVREESGNRTSKEIFIDTVDEEPNL